MALLHYLHDFIKSFIDIFNCGFAYLQILHLKVCSIDLVNNDEKYRVNIENKESKESPNESIIWKGKGALRAEVLICINLGPLCGFSPRTNSPSARRTTAIGSRSR